MPSDFHLRGNSLFVCDMRPGFTEDGVAVQLSPGRYQWSRLDSAGQGIARFQLLRAEAKAETQKVLTELSIDGAMVGGFERGKLLSCFETDFERLYEWSASQVEELSGEGLGVFQHDSGLDCLWASVGGDGQCKLSSLFSSDESVGFILEVIPSIPKVGGRTLTQAWFHWSPIEEAFHFVHDRDFELDPNEVLEDILLDLTVDAEIEAPGTKITISPDDALKRWKPDFSGVSRIQVFEEADQEERALRVPSANVTLGEGTTIKDLADQAYQIMVEALEA